MCIIIPMCLDLGIYLFSALTLLHRTLVKRISSLNSPNHLRVWRFLESWLNTLQLIWRKKQMAVLVLYFLVKLHILCRSKRKHTIATNYNIKGQACLQPDGPCSENYTIFLFKGIALKMHYQQINVLERDWLVSLCPSLRFALPIKFQHLHLNYYSYISLPLANPLAVTSECFISCVLKLRSSFMLFNSAGVGRLWVRAMFWNKFNQSINNNKRIYNAYKMSEKRGREGMLMTFCVNVFFTVREQNWLKQMVWKEFGPIKL